MMDSSSAWASHDPMLPTTGQDEFQFLDMNMGNMSDTMTFDFQDFANQHAAQQFSTQHNADAMDTDMVMMNAKNGMMQSHMPAQNGAVDLSLMANSPMELNLGGNGSMADLDAQINFLQQQRQQQAARLEAQQRQQQQQQQQQQRQYYTTRRMIPPTPTSIEMHNANQPQFYNQQPDQQQRAMYENYQMLKQQQEVAFTPLGTPAVTPLEAHFHISDFAPSSAFSPLSSPALRAQSDQQAAFERQLHHSSVATSPIDMSTMDLNAPSSAGSGARRTTRKPAMKPKSRSVRQSPIVKPQRRKTASTTLSPQAVSEIMEPASQQKGQLQTQVIQARIATSSHSTTDNSTNGSISPEALSEMAPPPLPRSAKSSPYLTAQNKQTRPANTIQSAAMSPATPASLMRLAQSNTASPIASALSEVLDDHPMDNFALPEAANPMRPKLAKIRTAPSSGQTTPTLETTAARSSGFILPSPSLVRPISARSSPQIANQNNSSTTSNSIPSVRSTPKLAVRGSAGATTSASKRKSIPSNVLISPALRPKISPSIKPLIRSSGTASPGLATLSRHPSLISMNGIDDDTASLLLTSKSNYQHILDNTHLPGVTYPSELSTNLTSKRTSHKIAEQGRRNRINSALQEMSTLLPRSGPGTSKDDDDRDEEDDADCDRDEEGGSGEKSDLKGVVKGGKAPKCGASQSANSKASTVENAIEYIKRLKRENEEAVARAEEAEKEVVLLKEKLGGLLT